MSVHLINRVRQHSACEYINLLYNELLLHRLVQCHQRPTISVVDFGSDSAWSLWQTYVPYRAKTRSEARSTVATTKLYVLQVVSEEYNVAIFRMTLSGFRCSILRCSEHGCHTMSVSRCLSSRRNEFDPSSVHVRFAVQEVALGQVCLRVLRFYPVSIIPQTHHTHFHKYKFEVWHGMT
jgi:hypothetical protein